MRVLVLEASLVAMCPADGASLLGSEGGESTAVPGSTDTSGGKVDMDEVTPPPTPMTTSGPESTSSSGGESTSPPATASTGGTNDEGACAGGTLLWRSDADFELADVQLESEEPYGALDVIYPSHAGEDGDDNHTIEAGVYTLDGERVRTYFDIYQVETVANARLVFRARRSGGVENISVKFGNHSLDGWIFGGYGVSFHEETAESKVEYYHNDHGDDKVVEDLDTPLDEDTWFWFRVDIQTSGTQKVLNAFVDYDGADDESWSWTPVMVDRRWDDEDWEPPDTPGGAQDSDEVEDGVYLGPLNRVWIRDNGDGVVEYHRVWLCALDEA